MKKINNNISDYAMMRLYLFGEYHGPITLSDNQEQILIYPEEKSIEKAIEFIPKHLDSMCKENIDDQLLLFQNECYMHDRGYSGYYYVPELELRELVNDMFESGYTYMIL